MTTNRDPGEKTEERKERWTVGALPDVGEMKRRRGRKDVLKVFGSRLLEAM